MYIFFQEAAADGAEAPPTSQGPSRGAGFVIPSTGNPEIDKKIKNLVKVRFYNKAVKCVF